MGALVNAKVDEEESVWVGEDEGPTYGRSYTGTVHDSVSTTNGGRHQRLASVQ